MGPAPFAGMMLADNGATGLRIVRPGAGAAASAGALERNRPFLELDLKSDSGRRRALDLAGAADIVIEGFRPGKLEQLNLSPRDLQRDNPRLVICRVTGWGQEGPLAQVAGHDLNFISLCGALHLMGPADRPPLPPLNLVGDFGGGMMCAFAALAGVLAARATGQGQVVDCAMTDAAAVMMTWMFDERSAGRWSDVRGTNQTDGSMPCYRTYETADGGYLAVAAIEPRFFANLAEMIGLEDGAAMLANRNAWPALAARLEHIFRNRTLQEWTDFLEGTDTCCTPVLAPGEAPRHPHNQARDAFRVTGGTVEPAPAPRFHAADGAVRPAWPAGSDDLSQWLPARG